MIIIVLYIVYYIRHKSPRQMVDTLTNNNIGLNSEECGYLKRVGTNSKYF